MQVIERREEIDWKRHAVFCTFGFCYLGAFQYWLYNVKFTQVCIPHLHLQFTAVQQTCIVAGVPLSLSHAVTFVVTVT